MMNLQQITELTTQDMKEVNEFILKQLNSHIGLINQLSCYVIEGGGKRIRPMVTILIARALGYQGKNHIQIAALIELIHTATLIHDDVIDQSDMRRGQATANYTFGNSASILVGDFIYSRAFQIMTNFNSLPILRLISNATNIIAEGEILQLMNIKNVDLHENDYMKIIYRKTARLFEAAAQAASILANATPHQEKFMRSYGRHLGSAFQLTDDLLDYEGSCKIGKNCGDDLDEGKPTLPILHIMQHGTPEQVKKIRHAISKGNGRCELSFILEAMREAGSLIYTKQKAQDEASKAIRAIKNLVDSPYKSALISLAKISASRTF